jgi:hypothetical protein
MRPSVVASIWMLASWFVSPCLAASGTPAAQQAAIPCVECRILEPGKTACPVCRGKGTVFVPARFVDSNQLYAMGAHRWQKVQAALEPARRIDQNLAAHPRPKYGTADVRSAWKRVAGELELALREMTIYGHIYTDGMLHGPPAEFRALVEPTLRLGATRHELDAVRDDAVRAYLRLAILAARRRS